MAKVSKNKKNDKTKKILIPVLAVALILLVVEGLTYAWLVFQTTGNARQVIKAGTLNLRLDDEASAGINLDKAIPMSDRQGMNTTAYTFTVENDGSMNASYTLYLEDEDVVGTKLEDSHIRYSLTKNGLYAEAHDLPAAVDGKRTLITTIINGARGGVSSIDSYELKIWVNGATTTSSAEKEYKAKIGLEAIQTESNATYTVTYNANGGTGSIAAGSGETVTIATNTFTAPDGQSFVKWNTKADGSGQDYAEGAVVSKDLVLYAIWN